MGSFPCYKQFLIHWIEDLIKWTYFNYMYWFRFYFYHDGIKLWIKFTSFQSEWRLSAFSKWEILIWLTAAMCKVYHLMLEVPASHSYLLNGQPSIILWCQNPKTMIFTLNSNSKCFIILNYVISNLPWELNLKCCWMVG